MHINVFQRDNHILKYEGDICPRIGETIYKTINGRTVKYKVVDVLWSFKEIEKHTFSPTIEIYVVEFIE